MPKITPRPYDARVFETLNGGGLSPVLARIYAARGIENTHQLETELTQLIPFQQFKNISLMANLLADAIAAKKRLLIVADYDSDGQPLALWASVFCAHLAPRLIIWYPIALNSAMD
jgi:single-stranded-DNA-specific exonuclease